MSDRLMILRDGSPIAVPVETIYPERGLLGEIKAWAGIRLPVGFAWCNGGEISIYSYPAFFFAIGAAFGEGAGALAFTLSITNGSTLVTSSANHGFAVGDPIGSTIAALSDITDPATLGLQYKYQIPMYVSEVVSATTFRVAEYGVGTNLSFTLTNSGHPVFSHVKTPDLRGRIAAGRDDMGGSAASRLTTGTGGFGAATLLGANGGSQSHTLTTAQLAAHTHTVNNATRIGYVGSGGAASVPGGSTYANANTSINDAGGGEAHPNCQPTLICNHIIRVS